MMNNSIRKNIIRFYEFPDMYDARLVHGSRVSHEFPRHIHHSWSLGIIEQGTRTFEIRQTQFSVAAGECFILAPDTPHACKTSKESRHVYWTLSTPPDLVQRIFSDLSAGTNCSPTFPLGSLRDAALYRMMQDFVEEAQQQGETFARKTLLIEMITHCLTQHAQAAYVVKTCKKPHRAIKAARKFLEAQFDRPMTLEEVAGVAGVSPFHFSRIFQQHVGIPPYEYLVKIRLHHAQILLKQGESIAGTAYSTGFSDQSHLTRFFKRHIGMTPGEYLRVHSS